MDLEDILEMLFAVADDEEDMEVLIAEDDDFFIIEVH